MSEVMIGAVLAAASLWVLWAAPLALRWAAQGASRLAAQRQTRYTPAPPLPRLKRCAACYERAARIGRELCAPCEASREGRR